MRVLRWPLIVISIAAALVLASWLAMNLILLHRANARLAALGPDAPMLVTAAGARVRDLNKNGVVDPYEDPAIPTEQRVNDLIHRMSLEEKAGMLFIDMVPVGRDGELVEAKSLNDKLSLVLPATSDMLLTRHMTNFNITATPDLDHWLAWYNRLQKLAERTRLGIPVTIASDPRHSGGSSILTGSASKQFSRWPEPLGIAATGDDAIAKAFGDAVRQEYRATGIQLALHPMADIASEPRWPRIDGTFGEDPVLVSRMVRGNVEGLQGQRLSSSSVLSMVKHFPGGGPQLDGGEPHFAWGKDQSYPSRNFAVHQQPFQSAFAAGAGAVMLSYGIPHGLSNAGVGAAFDKEIVTGMLRERDKFDGIICSDWGLISPLKLLGLVTILPPRAWGAESVGESERARLLLDAGVDLIGGEHNPAWVVQLVRDGRIPESRIDQSVRRLLRAKFELGLFDNPYIDATKSRQVLGRKDLVEAGLDAQRKSMVLLKAGPLPLRRNLRLYVENIDPALAAKYGQVVSRPDESDVALVRIDTPFVPRSGTFESYFRGGDLDLKGEQRSHLVELMSKVPTVIDIHLQRPAVIPELNQSALALSGSFGASDVVFLGMVFGEFVPTGRLPFELPRSMKAVRAQKPDLPHDSVAPLFPIGWRAELASKNVANRPY